MSLKTVHADSPISASGIKDYEGCPRYFAFKKLEELETPGGAAADHGKMIHAQNEGWIRFGKLPEHAHALKLLSLFAGNKYAPMPDGSTEAEHEFHLRIAGVYYRGFMDWRRVREAGQIIVGDWKTTSDVAAYGLRADRGVLVDAEGRADIQSTLYAAKEFVGGADEVYANWAYVATKGELRSKLVDAKFDRQHVEDVYGSRIHPAALEIRELYRIRPKANDVPYRSSYCFAYHRPCHFTTRCVKPQGMFAHQPLDLTQEGNITMASFLDSIRGSFPVPEDDAPPPPPPEDDAPPPPPPEDEDDELTDAEMLAIPTSTSISLGLGSDDDDAPPPPPEDENSAAEKLVEEYFASKGKTMPRSISKVESGFVNPPEAEGIIAAESPEDARARFECAPPKPEKPKKAKKPTKKELAALEATSIVIPRKMTSETKVALEGAVEAVPVSEEKAREIEKKAQSIVEERMRRQAELDDATPDSNPVEQTLTGEIRVIVREELDALLFRLANRLGAR